MSGGDLGWLPLYRKERFRANIQRSASVRTRRRTARTAQTAIRKNLSRGQSQCWRQNLIGRLGMSRSRLALIAMMLLSMGFVLYPQDSANAAKFCMQLRGSTAAGHVDCSFSTLDACRARVRHRGG